MSFELELEVTDFEPTTGMRPLEPKDPSLEKTSNADKSDRSSPNDITKFL